MHPGPTSPSWWSVTAWCDPSLAEVAADVLWSFDPPAVEERLDETGRSVLVSGFAERSTADDAARSLGSLPDCAVEVTPVADDGLDAWRVHASVVHAGPFTLVPTWLEHEPTPGEVVVHLDPGRAFGSGSHPTTRLTLEVAAPHLGPGTRVLDVGCGSGVLSIAAALAGAEVLAIDVEPEALDATRANAVRNGVADHVTVDIRPLPAVVDDGGAGRFDLVLANLLAPVVRDLAPHLVRAVAPHGRLIVSGLLEDRWPAGVDVLTTQGSLTVVEVAADDGWVAVTLTDPRSASTA